MARAIQALVFFIIVLCAQGANSAVFTVRNNCRFTVWLGALTASNSAPLPTTGAELRPGYATSFTAPFKWSGRMWGRTGCRTDASGRFFCSTGDCGSGQIPCNGAGGAPPASLAEFTLNSDAGGKDFYDTSLVDGFNVPIGIRPVARGCSASVCAADINSRCPPELQVKGPMGIVVACKSACLAFNDDRHCCRGAFGSPQTCTPTNYSQIFKSACPQSYSYAFDDASISHATIFTIKNNCPFTVWLGTLAGSSSAALPTTGAELPPGHAISFISPFKWSGRMWGRTGCSTDSSCRFSCATGDCGSGQIPCNGAGGSPPASLSEFTLNSAADGKDFYDTNLVDGFNVPVGITPVAGGCDSTVCAADMNCRCPPELQVKAPGGNVVACKSACLAFNDDWHCCRGAFGSPESCTPMNYSEIFKAACPQSYTHAFDDASSTFTCPGSNYAVNFCPQKSTLTYQLML
ncbi:Thaumatin-like protein 1 [Apostasia shenzhenica]|uniref:Thaumatin-like protein 1 n=1 Tax=Apostasia shenzhenica TaxID=1088818 RepID=A0A2I0AB63_9ASPA|nr:Thaumatin-like protein 1 [Apostasia shenzhenica]